MRTDTNNTNNTKQAAWVAIGSLCSFGFTIVSSMVLSRYFDKSDYGTYKQVMYVYNTLLTVFTLGLPKAYSYFIPRVDVSQARSLINKITSLFFVLGFLFSLTLFLFSSIIASFLNNPDLELALRIFAPVPLLMLPTMGLDGILSSFRMNSFLTVYTILTRIMMLVCVVVPVVFWKGGYTEAIIGFTVSSLFSCVLALYLKNKPVKGRGKEKTLVSIKEILHFSIPLLTASIWGVLISSADQFFISRYYGSHTFAEFSNGAIELPFVGMIVSACSIVLSPVFSRMHYEKVDPKREIFPLWTSVFRKSAMLIYPVLIYCIVFADVIMIVLYGHQYEVSASYSRIKLLVDFFRVAAFAPLLINIGEVKFYSNVHMYGALILILLEYICVKTVNSPLVLLSISVLCTIGRIFVIFAFIAKYFCIKIYELLPLRLMATICLPSFALLLLLHLCLVELFNVNKLITLLLSLGIYFICYMIYSHFMRLNYMSVIKPLLKK